MPSVRRGRTLRFAGQLTTTVNGSTTTTYVFDARGNRTKATTGTTVTSYGYDQANRLTSYTRGTTTATYTYNGDGLRASKTTGGTTTKFVYDTAQGMPLILNDGANSYLYGPGGVPFEQITTAGVASYLHADQLGSIRMITNTTGANAGTASYTAYGTRITTGTTSVFGYAVQYTDTETGLQWDRARYYDPTTGQFLTVDPLAASTRARYSYASGNPITGADPGGLDDSGWWTAVVAVVVAVVVVAVVVAVVVVVACIAAEPCAAALAVAGGAEAIEAFGAAGVLADVTIGAEEETTAEAEAAVGATEQVAQAAEADCPLAESGPKINEGDLNHIFTINGGHSLQDTPANRALIEGVVKPENYVRTGRGGEDLYRELQADGTQNWAKVWNGSITNGGINQNPHK